MTPVSMMPQPQLSRAKDLALVGFAYDLATLLMSGFVFALSTAESLFLQEHIVRGWLSVR